MLYEKVFDFHNLNKTNNTEVEFKTLEFINNCYVEKLSPILIITGKGREIVKRSVIKVLKNNKLILKFQSPSPDDNNEGAIAVWLID